ncbi:MAG: hypothetical protein ACOYOK_01300 [Pseudobdellovibrionaceae bacterium]
MKSYLKIYFASFLFLQSCLFPTGLLAGGVVVDGGVDNPSTSVDRGSKVIYIDYSKEASDDGDGGGSSDSGEGGSSHSGRGEHYGDGKNYDGYDSRDSTSTNYNASRLNAHQIQQRRKNFINSVNESVVASSQALSKELEASRAEFLKNQALTSDTMARINANLQSGSALNATSSSIDPVEATLAAALGANYTDADNTLWNYNDPYPYTSSHAEELENLRRKLELANPRDPIRRHAHKAAYQALRKSDDSYAGGFEFNIYMFNPAVEGKFWQTTAEILIDIATDLNPITSVGKSIFTLTTGRTLLGDQATSFDYGVSALNLVTIGFGGLAFKTGFTVADRAVEVLRRFANFEGAKIPFSKTANLVQNHWAGFFRSSEQGLTKFGKILAVHSPEALNRAALKIGQKAQWLEGEANHVIEALLPKGSQYIRVWGGEADEVGSWLTSVEQIEGKSVQEIRELLALPKEWNEISKISKVTLKEPLVAKIGLAGPQRTIHGQILQGGGVQVQLMTKLPKDELKKILIFDPIR